MPSKRIRLRNRQIRRKKFERIRMRRFRDNNGQAVQVIEPMPVNNPAPVLTATAPVMTPGRFIRILKSLFGIS